MLIRPLIATPTHDYKFCFNYHQSIVKLTTRDVRSDVKLGFVHLAGVSMINRARDLIVDYFLKGDWSHLFFIDSDMGFDHWDFYRFLDAEKDVVCGIYPKRVDESATYIPRPNTSDPFVEVDAAATGFMCIRRSVIETLAVKMPELVAQEDGETRHMFFLPYGLMGEDYSFCFRWKHLGGNIFIDT
jgi:hypothetical protein